MPSTGTKTIPSKIRVFVMICTYISCELTKDVSVCSENEITNNTLEPSYPTSFGIYLQCIFVD